MANINGLTSLAPVYFSGDPDSNIWATRVEPTVINSITLVSPDGTKTGSISEANNGQMTIGTASGIVNVISDDGVSANFLFSNNDALEVVGLNSALLESYNSGVKVIAGTQASVQVADGALGRIYDTVYNPTYTTTLLADNVTDNPIAYNITATRPAGVYQLQLSIRAAIPGSSSILDIGCSAPPSEDLINFSGAAINAAAVSNGQNVSLVSGFFTHAGGELSVVVASTGNLWTAAAWSLQLIKMG